MATIEICAGCAVRRPCLEDALGSVEIETVGTWGGSTTLERRKAKGTPRSTDDRHYPRSRAAIVQSAADLLEVTLDERLQRWRERTRALQARLEADRSRQMPAEIAPPMAVEGGRIMHGSRIRG